MRSKRKSVIVDQVADLDNLLLIPDMISTNSPLFAKSMSVPKEMNQLCVEAFTAGIVEAALDGLGFVGAISV